MSQLDNETAEWLDKPRLYSMKWVFGVLYSMFRMDPICKQLTKNGKNNNETHAIRCACYRHKGHV